LRIDPATPAFFTVFFLRQAFAGRDIR